jgi:hypothetical protein
MKNLINAGLELIRQFTNEFTRAIGYTDLRDMITSILLIKNLGISLIVLLSSISLSLMMLIEQYVYSPVLAFIVAIVACVGESISGTYANVKVNGEKFDLNKALRFIPKTLSHAYFLSMAYHIAQAEILLAWLPSTVFIYLTAINFLKSVRNAGKLKWIEGSFVQFLESNITDKTNLKIKIKE